MPGTSLPPAVFLAIAAVVVLVLTGLWLAMPQRTRMPSDHSRLTGTWSYGRSRAPDASRAGLVTFHADGTLIADGTLVQTVAPQPGTTVGHGEWHRVDVGVFEATIWVLRFAETGALAGRMELTETIRLEPGGTEATISQRARAWEVAGRETALESAGMPAAVLHAWRLRGAADEEGPSAAGT